jgi:hypothetical protein
MSPARDLLLTQLEAANYPIRETDTLTESDDYVELATILVQTTGRRMNSMR